MQGQADHAGPSPMHLRHDALTAAAHVISGVERLAIEQDDTAVATRRAPSLGPKSSTPFRGRAPSASISGTAIPPCSICRSTGCTTSSIRSARSAASTARSTASGPANRRHSIPPSWARSARLPGARPARARTLVRRRSRRQIRRRCLPGRHDLHPQPGRPLPLRNRTEQRRRPDCRRKCTAARDDGTGGVTLTGS